MNERIIIRNNNNNNNVFSADYTIVQSSLTITLSSNTTRACVDVNIIDDIVDEDLEFILFGLTIPSGNEFVLNPEASSSQINITDNDGEI